MLRLAIREVAPGDAGDLVRMGFEFFSHSQVARFSRFDPESLLEYIRAGILGGMLGVFVAEHEGKVVGATAVGIAPFFFNFEDLCGQELFWWIDPDFRGGRAAFDMKAAIEEWAKSRGAKAMVMHSVEGPNSAQVGKVYQRTGYTPFEHSYLKEFSCQP